MRCCGNCMWGFSPLNEDDLRSEYSGEDYELDNMPKAGDCCLSKEHNKDYYCTSHSYDESSDEYYRYIKLNIDKYVSIDLYNMIRESWSYKTNGLDEEDMLFLNPSTKQDDVTSLLIKDLFGGKIMSTLSVTGKHYYNLIDGNIIDLTSDQFDEGEEPLYSIGEEDYPIIDDDLISRYKVLLKNLNENLCDFTFNEIDGDDRIMAHREFLKSLFVYSTFEIDYYYQDGNSEYVQFDLSAQNTGNIFRYKHNLITDEYELCEMPVIYSTTGEYICELPIDFIKSVFDVARDNVENIRNLDKVRRINPYK